MTRLEADGFVLRPWRAGDEDSLVELAGNRNVWRNMVDRFPHPYSRDAGASWVVVANERELDQRHWAIEMDGRAIGSVGFERKSDIHRRTAEIGYWLGEPYWGRGIAAKALTLATEVALRNYDFARIQATTMSWNARSGRVLEKAGYTHEATLRNHIFKDGTLCDQHVYVFPLR